MLIFLPVLLMAIVVHEVAHAWQARREGDDTAERLGRITLNPIPHLDLVGSFIVPGMLWFIGAGFLFGWAKPVPVDPRNYRDYVAGDIRVSLAGIVSNLILAVLCTLLMAVVYKAQSIFSGGDAAFALVALVLWYSIFINLILAFFNLIPIPPLDGSHVLAHLLPEGLRAPYRAAGQFGFMILIGIMWLVPSGFTILLAPVEWLVGIADQFARLWI